MIRWITALGCLCILVALADSAAVPTQDTLVVARADNEEVGQTTEYIDSETETPNSKVTEASTEAVSTEGPLPPLKLTEMDVQSNVAMRYAHTAVVTRVRNPAKRAQEATFRVLLPETAFISGFTMTLDGKAYKAYVKEKEEAKQIYNEAVSQGIAAAHIAAKARDSNHFTVSVNVEPNTVAIFNLTYEEMLVRRNGVYNQAINLHPGQLVPKLKVTVHIKEAQKITALRVPEVRTGNEIDATEGDAQNAKAVIERGHDDREATITFAPDIEEQRRLMEIYADKSKESQSQAPKRWYGYDSEDKNSSPDGILGQFVVQYDVERPKEGEILVNDGYFVHFFAPSSLPPLSKHVVFVLDTSGSMSFRKIEQLRDAMQTILGELNPGDYFNIVEFDIDVDVHNLNEADEPEKRKVYNYYQTRPTVLVPPALATPENIAKAKIITSRLKASGGTNIAGALDVAIDLIRRGVGWTPEAEPTPANTTQDKTTEAQATTPVPSTTEENKEVEMKADVSDDDHKPEPIIIFLTDGEPTYGETDPKSIIKSLSEKNFGNKKASIFSLAFGEDADRKFLRQLSLRNDGFMRHIYEASDAALQLRDFYRQVSSPLLADVNFVYPPEQIKEGSLTKHKFRTFYAGSETVVAGRLADNAEEISPHVYGICGVTDEFIKKQYEVFPKVPVSRAKGAYLPLERLWAYLTIKQLLDERDAADLPPGQPDENSPEKKALTIALKYEFVTPLTSLVVVKPNATKAVDAESVDSNKGVGYPQFGSPGIPLSTGAQLSALLPSPQYAFMRRSGVVNHSYLSSSGSSSYSAFSIARPVFMPMRSDIADAGFSYERAVPQVDLLQSSWVPTTSGTVSFTGPPEATTAAATDRIAALHLQNITFVQPLLSDTSDDFTVNNTKLELSRDEQAPVEAGGDAPCSPAAHATDGTCVYLTRCSASQRVSLEEYSVTFCKVNNRFAGICCAQGDILTV